MPWMHSHCWYNFANRLAFPWVVVVVRNALGVLPSVAEVGDDGFHADAVLYLGKNEGAGDANHVSVAFHDGEVGADAGGEVGFVDDEEVGLGDAGSALAGEFVAAADINYLDGEIGEFAAEAGGKVVAPGFDEQDLRLEQAVEFFQGHEIGGDVFANGSVGAAAGFDGADAGGFQGLVLGEKLAVFLGKNVIGNGGEAEGFAQPEAELEHEGGLAAADGAADADGEGAFFEVAVTRQFAFVKVAGMGGVVMGMAGATLGMKM